MFRRFGPEIEKAVIEHHLANSGVSRFEKFRHYYENFLGRSITEFDLKALGEEFSRLVLRGVLDSAYVPGALETLELLKEVNTPCFVASGTPDEELKFIVEEKGLSGYFLEIHGSPKNKKDIVLDVVRRYSLAPDRCLFIGDAIADFDAAKRSGTAFLGIVVDACASPFPLGTWIEDRVTLLESKTEGFDR